MRSGPVSKRVSSLLDWGKFSSTTSLKSVSESIRCEDDYDDDERETRSGMLIGW